MCLPEAAAPGSGSLASLTHIWPPSLSPFPSTNELEAIKVFLPFPLHLYVRNSQGSSPKESPSGSLASGVARENTGHPVTLEFQINNTQL